MKAMLIGLAAAMAMGAGVAQAAGADDLLKEKKCLNCHDMEKKKVGPAFKDIAAKHKGDKEAEGKLAAKLKEGKGHAKVAASDAELKTMLEAVLAGK